MLARPGPGHSCASRPRDWPCPARVVLTGRDRDPQQDDGRHPPGQADDPHLGYLRALHFW